MNNIRQSLLLLVTLTALAQSPAVLIDSDTAAILAINADQQAARADIAESQRSLDAANARLNNANAKLEAKLTELRSSYKCDHCKLNRINDDRGIFVELRWEKPPEPKITVMK